ncbi:MAG: DUF2628 domain-containing protein [Hyphomonadaceae bacterium]|jgi:hypothetical protein|nr:DUF2628 domain-containing protein [Hyphomonadaceae bacterium]
MLTFTVHEPPHPPADRIDRAESLVFIKDGFSWTAALFSPIWLLMHRLWWPLLGYVVVSGLFELARWSAAMGPGWLTLAGVALHLLIGFEADTLRRWALDRRGWRTLGSVSDRNAAECERRFFQEWLPRQPLIASASGPSAPGVATGRTTPIIGSLLGVRS